jgi:hypothetical protein
MDAITVLGFAAATPDAALRESLPFAAADIDRALIPAALRRRVSQATQLAFSAAAAACVRARRSPGELPAVFASVGGEIGVTDALCLELGKPAGLLSPTAFHNSVHNTAAAYWSIAHRGVRATCSLAAGRDTFAMAWLDAWCLLESQGGELLLACYDERWPEYLAGPVGATAFASALVLAAGRISEGIAEIHRPRQVSRREQVNEAWADLMAKVPAAAAIPLLATLAGGGPAREVTLSAAAPDWAVNVQPLRATENQKTV